MSAPSDVLLRIDTHRLADAVTQIVTNDLDLLYGERVLRANTGPRGPRRDAAHAASSIAYLSSQLLRQILNYQRSIALYHEQEARRAIEDSSGENDDVPW